MALRSRSEAVLIFTLLLRVEAELLRRGYRS